MPARNCYYGASFPSLEELSGREAVAVEQILWGNDYPHYEGTFPYTHASLQLTFPGLPDNERRLILGENAARLSFTILIWRNCVRWRPQVGPTPAQIETPLLEIPADTGLLPIQQCSPGAAHTC